MFDLPSPADDGLYTPTVGAWSAQKHHFLRRYIDGFTTAMHSKRWAGLHYIDLFASAGIERIEGTHTLDWGSPLIAAQAPYKFARLHLCELKKKSFDALTARLARFPQPSAPQLLKGDSNVLVQQIVGTIPNGTLSLAFLDPYGLNLHYATIQRLATLNVDLIIFFPDHLDALRNWEIHYQKQPDSRLDQVLGTQAWRSAFQNEPRDRLAEVLTSLYVNQLRRFGYTEFEFERIKRSDGRELYKLIFCSRDKAGGQIWRGISSRKADGQNTFDFGS